MPELIPKRPGRIPKRTTEQIIDSAAQLGPPYRLRVEFRLFAPHDEQTTRRTYYRLPGVRYQLTFDSTDGLWAFFKQIHTAVTDIIDRQTRKENRRP